jgi:hypothetical protein
VPSHASRAPSRSAAPCGNIPTENPGSLVCASIAGKTSAHKKYYGPMFWIVARRGLIAGGCQVFDCAVKKAPKTRSLFPISIDAAPTRSSGPLLPQPHYLSYDPQQTSPHTITMGRRFGLLLNVGFKLAAIPTCCPLPTRPILDPYRILTIFRLTNGLMLGCECCVRGCCGATSAKQCLFQVFCSRNGIDFLRIY